MNNAQSNGRLRLMQAIQNCEYDYYSSLPQSEEPIHYSARYLRKIRSLHRKIDFSVLLPRPTTRKYTAAILLTAILFFTGIFSVAQARNAVAEWFTNICERFTEIFFSEQDADKAPDSIESPHAPTKIPLNFTEKDRYFAQGELKLTWENERGEYIVFIQTPLHAQTTLDNEQIEYETTVISEKNCILIQKKEKICIFWNTDDYAFTLIVPQSLPREQWSDIIGSVRKTSFDGSS